MTYVSTVKKPDRRARLPASLYNNKMRSCIIFLSIYIYFMFFFVIFNYVVKTMLEMWPKHIFRIM